MAPRKPAVPEDGAEEAQAQPADAPKVESNLALFQRLIADMRKQLKAELGSSIGTLTTQVGNLEALVTSMEPPGAATALDEEALQDKIQSVLDERAKLSPIEPIREEMAAFAGFVRDALSTTNKRLAQLEQEPTEITRVVGEPHSQPGAPAILRALWNVMQDVTYVPKSGTYEGGSSGNYKFRRFDDVAKELGEAFRRHGIFLKPQVVQLDTDRFETVKEYKNGGKNVQTWSSAHVRMSYTFVSLEDGSEQTVSVVGEGRDLSDKSTAKALTMALKTMLTQAFMLPSDAPDPDSERPGDEPQNWSQDEEVRRVVRDEYAVTGGARVGESVADLPPERRAARALGYAKSARTLADLTLVVSKAREAGLTEVKLADGETLMQKLLALRHTLGGAQEPPPEEG